MANENTESRKPAKSGFMPAKGYGIIILIMALVAAAFMVMLTLVSAFPKEITMAFVGLLFVLLIPVFFLFKRRRKGFRILGLLLAVVFTFVVKILLVAGISWTTGGFGNSLWECLLYIIQINLVLMIFNLIPVPPLDGFNIIAQIFNFGQKEIYWKIYQYGNWLLVILIITGITGMIISPCVNFLYNLLVNLIIY